MTTKSLNENTTSREMPARSGLRTKLNPLLAGLGLVPRGALLPELSGWRRRVQGRTA